MGHHKRAGNGTFDDGPVIRAKGGEGLLVLPRRWGLDSSRLEQRECGNENANGVVS
jgi:hypothetical protein